MEFSFTSVEYKVETEKAKQLPPHGEVFVDARKGAPIVWVEDREITRVKPAEPSVPQSSKAGASAGKKSK